ncbi:MAG: dTMP kinase [Deltaproteobacteria bacterium]|nr:dTMP kinase [Deltaproteobacteria bacterium]
MDEQRRGRLIALEGIDGVGTTTQAHLLCERLAAAGHRVHRTYEPSGGPIGTLLRQVLTGRLRRGGTDANERVGPEVVAALFAADRLDHLESEILPRLEEGVHVITDRYVLSSLAYQGVDCELTWVKAINARALPADLTLLLEISADEALKRRADRHGPDERFDALELQRRIAAAYAERADDPDYTSPVVRIDANPSVEQVAEEIWQAIAPLLTADS